MKKYFLLPAFVAAAFPAMSQSIVFADDALGRGYVDRPYLRYEAEEGSISAIGNVDFINADPYDQASLASEASNLQAAQLTSAGSYIEWKLDADADALTIRFSLPDGTDGSGTRQRLAVRSGSKTLGEIELDSYWAWQYTPKANVSEKYPDNTPDPSKFARMRFDEARLVLSETIAKGSVLRIERLSDGADPMAIDFVEAEMAGKPLTFSDITDDNKVEFAGDGTALQAFINANPGKTIFIPAGRYEIPSQIEIRAEGTRLAGAGMWHTELFFSERQPAHLQPPRHSLLTKQLWRQRHRQDSHLPQLLAQHRQHLQDARQESLEPLERPLRARHHGHPLRRLKIFVEEKLAGTGIFR